MTMSCNSCLFVFVHCKLVPVFLFVSSAQHIFIARIYISPLFFTDDTLLQGSSIWYGVSWDDTCYLAYIQVPGGTSGSRCDLYGVNNGWFQLRDADCMGPWEGFHSADNVVAQQVMHWLTSVIRIYAHLYSVMFKKFDVTYKSCSLHIYLWWICTV